MPESPGGFQSRYLSSRLSFLSSERGARLLEWGFVDVFAHLGGHAIGAHVFQPHGVNARVLILVLNLAAAFLDADVGALGFGIAAPLLDDRIALGAEQIGEIAGGLGAGVELLVIHAVW